MVKLVVWECHLVNFLKGRLSFNQHYHQDTEYFYYQKKIPYDYLQSGLASCTHSACDH